MYSFSFERLEVWNRSRLLTKSVYEITRDFPDIEKFGIASQLQRAMVSVCSNIAEGSSRKSKKEQCHFYSLSYSSLMESLNQLIISNDLGYVSDPELFLFRKEVHIISIMLNNLRKYTTT